MDDESLLLIVVELMSSSMDRYMLQVQHTVFFTRMSGALGNTLQSPYPMVFCHS